MIIIVQTLQLALKEGREGWGWGGAKLSRKEA